MSKHIQLAITNPCHENSDQMTQAAKGRFCAACQKQVMDFTNMSDSQLAAFFKKSSEGSVCGRFYADQLERNIKIPKKRIPWVKYFFQFTLPAFLISMKATAQGNVKLVKQDTIKKSGRVNSVVSCYSPETPMNNMTSNKISLPLFGSGSSAMELVLPVKSTPQLIAVDEKRIRGKVVDDEGKPIAWATIVIKGTNKGTLADKDGNFSITPEEGWHTVILVTSCVGFETIEIKVENTGRDMNIISPVRLQYALMGEVVVVKRPQKKKAPKPTPQLIQKFMDTAFKFFKIFPNPVHPGASLHIEWKKMEEGYYLLELLDLSGKKVYSNQTWIDAEARVIDIEIPSVATGNYFLQVSNKESGKSFTEKVIIQ